MSLQPVDETTARSCGCSGGECQAEVSLSELRVVLYYSFCVFRAAAFGPDEANLAAQLAKVVHNLPRAIEELNAGRDVLALGAVCHTATEFWRAEILGRASCAPLARDWLRNAFPTMPV